MGPLAALRPLRRVSQVPEHTTTFHEHDVARGRPLFDPLSGHGKKALKIFDRAKNDSHPTSRGSLRVRTTDNRRWRRISATATRRRSVQRSTKRSYSAHTSRLSTKHRCTTSTRDKRYRFLLDTLYKPCASPVQVPCKPRRNPVESLFARSVVPTIVPSLSNLVELFLVRLSLPAIPTLDLSPLLPNVSFRIGVSHSHC